MILDEMFKELKEKGYIKDKSCYIRDIIVYDERRKYKVGDRAIWKNGIFEKQPNGTWHKVAEVDNANYATPRTKSERRRFVNALAEAKKTCASENAWRVDNTHKQIDYQNDYICMTAGGSVAAVTKDGDIISVCKNQNDKTKGKELLAKAVKAGGTKLDSYDGNFGFYTKCGFEPVSWCDFEEEYAPEDWKKGRDKAEPIIFFKYVGIGNVKYTDIGNFYKQVSKSKNYDTAQAKRDGGKK